MMEALLNIAQRASARDLGGEAPSAIELSAMMRCAVNAPDHGRLRPWRFLVVEGRGLDALGEVFAAASCNANQARSDLARLNARRAPLVIVAILCLADGSKISELEQTLAVGAAVENLILAARALGYGSMWKTGSLALDRVVLGGLGIGKHERIAGFIYIGEEVGRARPAPRPEPESFFSRWPEEAA